MEDIDTQNNDQYLEEDKEDEYNEETKIDEILKEKIDEKIEEKTGDETKDIIESNKENITQEKIEEKENQVQQEEREKQIKEKESTVEDISDSEIDSDSGSDSGSVPEEDEYENLYSTNSNYCMSNSIDLSFSEKNKYEVTDRKDNDIDDEDSINREINIPEPIELKEGIDSLQTGDLLLCKGYYFGSRIIEYFLGSSWSHIGMIVKDPDFLVTKDGIQKGLFVLESTGNFESDIESGSYKYGIQISKLENYIKDYYGELYIRKLDWNSSDMYFKSIQSRDSRMNLQEEQKEEQNGKDDKNEKEDKGKDGNKEEEKIEDEYIIIDAKSSLMADSSTENGRRNNLLRPLYQTMYNKSYDSNIFDLAAIAFPKLLGWLHHYRRTDEFVCSSFVGYIFTMFGLLKKETDWSLYGPDKFASIEELENGGKLGELIKIQV